VCLFKMKILRNLFLLAVLNESWDRLSTKKPFIHDTAMYIQIHIICMKVFLRWWFFVYEWRCVTHTAFYYVFYYVGYYFSTVHAVTNRWMRAMLRTTQADHILVVGNWCQKDNLNMLNLSHFYCITRLFGIKSVQ